VKLDRQVLSVSLVRKVHRVLLGPLVLKAQPVPPVRQARRVHRERRVKSDRQVPSASPVRKVHPDLWD
jgi:hypothetical protein